LSKTKGTRKAKRSRTLDKAAILKVAAAHARTINERLAQRSADTSKIDTTIPQPVLTFLENLYVTPPLEVPNGKDFWADIESVGAIIAALRDAYRHGCREGYIEGFVARREPDRRRSRTANDAKKHQLVEVEGGTMTRAEREEAVWAEYPTLLKLMKPTPAKQRLAGKYGFESWQGVDAVIKRMKARNSQ